MVRCTLHRFPGHDVARAQVLGRPGRGEHVIQPQPRQARRVRTARATRIAERTVPSLRSARRASCALSRPSSPRRPKVPRRRTGSMSRTKTSGQLGGTVGQTPPFIGWPMRAATRAEKTPWVGNLAAKARAPLPNPVPSVTPPSPGLDPRGRDPTEAETGRRIHGGTGRPRPASAKRSGSERGRRPQLEGASLWSCSKSIDDPAPLPPATAPSNRRRRKSQKRTGEGVLEGERQAVAFVPVSVWDSQSSPVELVWWSPYEAVSRDHSCDDSTGLPGFAESYLGEKQPLRDQM